MPDNFLDALRNNNETVLGSIAIILASMAITLSMTWTMLGKPTLKSKKEPENNNLVSINTLIELMKAQSDLNDRLLDLLEEKNNKNDKES